MRKPYTRLYCHLVWATWDRLPLIHPDYEAPLCGAVEVKVRDLGGVCLAIGGTADHVHCLCSLTPTLTVAYLVQQIKGASSHLMNHEVVGEGQFRWQGSYGAFTVDPNGLQAVTAYIRNQKQHHDQAGLVAEWEQMWFPDARECARE